MAFPAYMYCRDPAENMDHIRERQAREKEYKEKLRPMKARRIAHLTKLAMKGLRK